MPDSDFYEKAAELLSSPAMVRHGVGLRVLGPNHQAFLKKHFFSRGTLLDIGCGEGHFLEGANRVGWHTAGIDLDRKALEVGKRRGLENLFCCALDDLSMPARFDCITFFEVLEHQPEPSAFMEKVKGLLAPGGFIAGSVPNRLRFRLRAFEDSDRPPYHFTRWSEASLKSFLARVGFFPITVENVGYGYYLTACFGLLGLRAKKLALKNHPSMDLRVCSFEEAGAELGMGRHLRGLIRAAKRGKNEVLRPFACMEMIFEKLLQKGQFLYFEADMRNTNE